MKNNIEIKDDYAIMHIGEEDFLIDIDDIEKIEARKWGIFITKNRNYSNPYARATFNGKKIFLHRYIMGVEYENGKEVLVDHISGDTRDNRKNNLRVCNAKENARNRKKMEYGINSHNGVHHLKANGKWRAYITVDGEWIHLGLFSTEEEAIKARERAEERYFGNFQRKKEKE